MTPKYAPPPEPTRDTVENRFAVTIHKEDITLAPEAMDVGCIYEFTYKNKTYAVFKNSQGQLILSETIR